MRIALGTAQFGMSYGVTNTAGRLAPDECAEILALARSYGVDTLDTAIGYGKAEAVLGAIGVQGLRVVTKLPAVPPDVADHTGWMERMVAGSLDRLKLDRLHGVLLHRPAQLLDARGAALYTALEALRDRGLTAGVGVSVYGPEELQAVASRYPLDVVQAPFNVFDRRLERSGSLARISRAGVEVHVRSVFLQGLLLTPGLPREFAGWADLHRRWSEWVEDQQVTKVRACVQFALSAEGVARVVVGVDSAAHLRQILSAAAEPCAAPPDDLSSTDIDLIDPSRWGRLAHVVPEATR